MVCSSVEESETLFLGTGAELVEMQFSKLLEKLRSPQLSPIMPLLLDLAVAFAPFLSEASLSSLFNLTSPLLDVCGDIMGVGGREVS